MTKPMYCPMAFNGWIADTKRSAIECTPDCAWALRINKSHYGCALACSAAATVPDGASINVRPLKDDAE